MTILRRPQNLLRYFALIFILTWCGAQPVNAQNKEQSNPTSDRSCRVENVDYKGWQAQQLSNHWVQLIFVPHNGGRLMQVTFGGHAYLFVNPKLAGKYFPPTHKQWFNYGGDKLWLLPEGNDDEQHWVGDSDVIDDSPFSFRKLSEGERCEIELSGPSDPQTGVQFVRTISLGQDSPEIHFHSTMKNTTGHPIEWSMQSVSQYDTGDGSANNGPGFNHDFWTFTPANPASSYLNRYHVRFGPVENPAASVREDGFFRLHYIHMAAELWLDSTAGWLAVVDGSSHYGMVERFHFEETRTYPGKASVIFWTNGRGVRVSPEGEPSINVEDDGGPHYLEAELNSPMCRLRPGESCTFDTEWFPTRTGNEFHGASDAGILIQPLRATSQQNDKIALAGSFGVFFAGKLIAHIYDEHGAKIGMTPVADVTPTEAITLHTEITPTGKAARVSLHLEDANGVDRGSLQEIRVSAGEER